MNTPAGPPTVDLPLVTERLALRLFADGDVADAMAVFGDPDVMRYVAGGRLRSAAACRRQLAAYGEHHARFGFSYWALVERDGGRLVGDAGLYHFQGRGPEIEIGYTLARDAWGRGYATEAARACLDAAFGPLGIERVVAVVEPPNTASVRVLEKIGMRADGRRRAYGREHLLYVADRPAAQAPG